METGIVACNLGIIATEEGLVLIDTPMLPSDAVNWRDEVAKKGEVRYLINTEGHPDHSQGDFFFPGIYISHEATRSRLQRSSLATVKERIKKADPASLPLLENYRTRLADITFKGNLTLNLGGLTFELFDLPGHVPGGIGVYIPEERIVFTGDIVFHRIKSWLDEAYPEKWLESLERIEALNAEFIVPGHGALCTKEYLKEQASIVRSWSQSIQSAVERGMGLEEAQATLACPDPYPIQKGLQTPEPEVNRRTIANLYDLAKKRNSGIGE